MVRVGQSSSSQPPKQPSKKTGVSKPPISKAPTVRKSKKTEILYVKSTHSGQHYGRSSLEDTRHIMAPNSASRADGDLEKDSPPPSPRRDNDNKFNRPKPYDFDGQLRFGYAKDAALYTALTDKGKWPIPLLFPVVEDLKTLEVWEEIRDLVVSSGMNFVFREDPGSFHDMTMEFISSFYPLHAPVMDGEDNIEGKVMGWRFALGNLQWEVKAEVLCDWLRLPRDGDIPEIVVEDIKEFWKRISGCGFTKDDQRKSTGIRVPKWNVIHKLLGGIVFVRTDYGKLVSKLELAIMLMMEKGKKIDWLWCITNGIQGNQSLTSKNMGLGGGSS